MADVVMVAMIVKQAHAVHRMPKAELINQEVVEVVHVKPYGDGHHEHP